MTEPRETAENAGSVASAALVENGESAGAAKSEPVGETGKAGGTGASPASRLRRGRRYVLIAGLAVVAVGGVAAAFVINDGGGGSPANAAAVPSATAPITKGDVVDSESVDGRLTFSNGRVLGADSSGTVTGTPAEGATITRGKTLYRVDNRPVVLMYGSLPLYRSLGQGDEGSDVRQLERNLKALGYGDSMTVDKDFTGATAAAVEEWQDDAGLRETGSVDASQVVFQPGAVRVSAVKTPVGQRVGGGPVLTVSGTESTVHVDLDAAKRHLARVGARVTVQLPDGTTLGGRVGRVGTVAEQSGDEENATSTIDVNITLDAEKNGNRAGNLDQAPVTVELESGRAANVLSVPIEALLGLREGGFGVEVVQGATSRIVPVQAGTFGAGRVQITGAGLREGMKVGVPAS